ncbi:MAG: flagellar biosynthesis protein FlgK [Hungatella sp.]|jgi:flagellar hook-associated protein 1 FlgK|nr:flagellar biosynthesis protein FlgK [Hungatella sp.]MCI9636423.1 flagellar biosynthesis protein FlgK [Hungatella sp.]
MVRASFAGFSTALSALQASQKRLDITGQNLANMNTAGYTRQQLKVSSLNYTNPVSHYMNSPDVSVGFGVHMDSVTQIRDPYLDAQYRGQMQKSGYTDALQTSLDRLSTLLDESHIDGIHSAFTEILTSLGNIQDPAKINDPIYESELRTRMQNLTNLLNQGAQDIKDAANQEFSRLDGTGTSEQGAVQQVNDLLQQIGNLNRRIKENQIMGQPSLELMDERNVLIDELSSYIPIEVTYFKDKDHDGIDNADSSKTDLSETYHVDSSGTPIMKKEWPDDLRITMQYRDDKGVLQTFTLVDGTEGRGAENYAKLDIPNSSAIQTGNADPRDLVLNFHKLDASGNIADPANPDVSFTKASGSQFASGSGSIQAGLDMLWKAGQTANDVRGYDYYMNELDKLAQTFADVMNKINIDGASKDDNIINDPNDDPKNHYILANREDNSYLDSSGNITITAANIGVNKNWVSGNVHISMAGDNATDTIMNMQEAMKTTYPHTGNLSSILGTPAPDLDNNSFADYMNHISTILANDSRGNQNALKTNVTVLNGIQNSRDSVSGVSLDEEASNMMMYVSAYSAASRLMTTLDEALNTLINGTGLVGR